MNTTQPDAACPSCTALRQQLAEAKLQIESLSLVQHRADRAERQLAQAQQERDARRIEAINLQSMLKRAESRLSALTQERDALKAGFEKLIVEAEHVVEDTAGAFVMAHIHGMPYKGRTMDLSAARKSLEALRPEAARDTRTEPTI